MRTATLPGTDRHLPSSSREFCSTTRRHKYKPEEERMAKTQNPIGVLGIGAMGHGMATSALREGMPTIVWNRTPEATRDLAELGAEVTETAAAAARRAPIVVTMVT